MGANPASVYRFSATPARAIERSKRRPEALQLLRTTLGVSTLPFYIFQSGGQTDPNPTTQANLDLGYTAIRDAEDSVEDPAQHIHIVTRVAKTFIARGMMNDIVHYAQSGYNEFGRTGAESVVKLAGLDTKTLDPITTTAAGLDVTVTGFFNLTGSCDASLFSIRFGDGSATDFFVPGGACAPRPYTIKHAFAAAGTYEVKASIGSEADVVAGIGGALAASTITVGP